VSEVEKRLSERGIEIFAGQIEDWNETSMLLFERLGYTRHDDIIYFTKRKNPEV
jgi:pyridoxine/pyridoxamine 5'-phosphate oxidase